MASSSIRAWRSTIFQTTAGGHVSAVSLTDGRVLPAGLVVVGIGARPATDWLASSGLSIPDGVECDAQLRVIGYPDIHAAGDVARWPHPLSGFPVRIEHWTNANELAASILGSPGPAVQPPYVCGHWVQIEHAAEFNRTVTQFVAST
jgi:NAD(P)H-nitrite reductase large subunit